MNAAGDARFLLPRGGRIVDGGRAGLVIAALPNPGTMRVAAPVRHRRAVAHAVRLLGQSARHRAGAFVARTGALGRVLPHVTVAPDAPPAFVELAARLGAPSVEWCLALSDPARDRKSAFHLFEADGDRPAAVAKFLREPGHAGRFDKGERGLQLIASAPAEVARAAPRLIGRGELDGHPVLVETALAGTSLERVLTGRAPRAAKVAAVERVVAWLHAVASTTQHAGGPGDEVERLREHVLPRCPVPLDDALTTASGAPAVLSHGDLWETNVLVDGDRLGVLDWDDAKARGFPLWDLLHLLLNALPLVDGARLQADRERLAMALVEGGAPSSPVFAAWLRDAAAVLGLDGQATGALLQLCMANWWLAHPRTTPGGPGSWFLPRVARWWVTSVGAGWQPS